MKTKNQQPKPKPCNKEKHNYALIKIGCSVYQKCTKCQDVKLPNLKQLICAHNWEDVPTSSMLGLRMCIKCGKQEVK